MRIEIHLRDTHTNGRRIGGRSLVLESCRVFNEAGDGIRLQNMARNAYAYFKAAAMCFLHPDGENLTNKKGKLPTEEQLVEAFGKEL